LTCIAGAVPHEARHSTVLSVKRPSGVVSPTPMPSRFCRCATTRSEPRSEQAMLRQTLIT
jgi:hypothetical protein